MSRLSDFPPLSREQLRELWISNPSPEVRRLLWEVARLQGIACRAWQLLESDPLMEGGSSGLSIVARMLRSEVEGECCVIDQREWQERLLNP